MKSSLKKVKDCAVKVAIEVEPDLVEKNFQDVFVGIQKHANLPGFRQGKAPMDLVQKKYEKEASEEVLKTLIPEVYHQVVSKHKLDPVCLPTISDISMERGQKLTFTAEVEVAPEVTIKNYKGLKITKGSSEVDPAEIEKGISSLLDSKAELIPLAEPRAIQKGDFIVSDIEMWRENAYAPGKKGVLLVAEPSEGDDFYEKIIGAQVDEVREISVEHSDEDKKKGLVGRKPAYKIWVRQIKEKKWPTLDDAFAKAFGKENVDELREAVRKDLAEHKQNEVYGQMKDELFNLLLKMATFALPEGLVEKQRERLLSQAKAHYARLGVTEEQFNSQKSKLDEGLYEKARDQVKLFFILKKVAEAENIDVSEEDLERRIQGIAEESGRSIEEARRVFGEDLRESILEKQTIEFLLAHANLQESHPSNKQSNQKEK